MDTADARFEAAVRMNALGGTRPTGVTGWSMKWLEHPVDGALMARASRALDYEPPGAPRVSSLYNPATGGQGTHRASDFVLTAVERKGPPASVEVSCGLVLRHRDSHPDDAYHGRDALRCTGMLYGVDATAPANKGTIRMRTHLRESSTTPAFGFVELRAKVLHADRHEHLLRITHQFPADHDEGNAPVAPTSLTARTGATKAGGTGAESPPGGGVRYVYVEGDTLTMMVPWLRRYNEWALTCGLDGLAAVVTQLKALCTRAATE